MKKKYTYICMTVCLFMSLIISAQEVTNVATTGLINPIGIAKKGNDLFISSVGNMSIQRKDLSDTSTTATTEFIPNFSFGIFLMIHGNDLYIPMLTSNKVVKIDVTDPSAALIDVVTNIDSPAGLAFRGNELYISLRQESKIIKIDVTQTNPTPVDVITGIPNASTVNGIAFDGDELYITHSGTISKINVTDSTPVLTEILSNVDAANVAIDGNYLYFAQPGNNSVSRINLTQATPTVNQFLTFSQDPWGLLIDGNSLYITEQNADRVVRFDLSTLGVDEASKRTFTYYPNPTKDFLHIAGLENNTPFTLTDVHGKEIIKGKLAETDKLDLSALANGIYFLRLNTYEVKKIIKY